MLEDAADSDPDLDRFGAGAGFEDDMDHDEALEDQRIMNEVREMSKSGRNKYGDEGTAFGIDDDDDDSDFEGERRGEAKEEAIGDSINLGMFLSHLFIMHLFQGPIRGGIKRNTSMAVIPTSKGGVRTTNLTTLRRTRRNWRPGRLPSCK